MMPAIGKDAYLGFGGESSWGSAGTIDEWTRVISMTPQNAKSNFISATRRAGMPRKVYFGAERAELEVVTPLMFNGHELFWAALFGTYTFSSDLPVVSAYTHEFEIGDDTITGITFQPHFGLGGTNDYKYTGMMPYKVRIELGTESEVTTTWSFAGKQETAPVVEAPPTFPEEVVALNNDAAIVTIGGASGAYVQSGFIEIERPRAMNRFLYGQTAAGRPIVNGPLNVNFQFTVEYDTASASVGSYDDFRTGTQGGRLTLAMISSQIITGATNYNFTFDVDQVQVVGDTPSVQDDGIVPLTITGMGLDPNEDSDGNCTLAIVNAVSAKAT